MDRVHKSQDAVQLRLDREKLPIHCHRSRIIQAIENSRVVILLGETGSGKTTQVPQYILDKMPSVRMAVTQPRRVAAITVAQRVSDEINRDKIGGIVGYSVRFEDMSCNRTQVRFLTDGMLVREALLHPCLDRYSVIILDEAHERTLQTDILFGVLKRALRCRTDLKVIVMSATLDVGLFKRYFTDQSITPRVIRIPGRQYPVDLFYSLKTLPDYQDAALITILQIHLEERRNGSILVFLTGQEDIDNLQTLQTDILFGVLKRALRCRTDLKVIVMSATLDVGLFKRYFTDQSITPRVIRIPGRQYPVDLFYSLKTLPDYQDAALITILQIHLEERRNGSILVFLTGQEDIDNLQSLLEQYAKTLPPTALKLMVCPIYAAMPREQQMKVFEPVIHGVRKVILATNIAETSITIKDVRYVVDTGLVKQRSYVPNSGVEMLQIEPVSKAQAWQRTGRAGREAPGVCYRLFPENTFDKLSDRTIPDIQRVSLEAVVLQLKSMGIDDILSFDFLEKPEVSSLIKAMEKLYAFEAFDIDGKLTKRGRQMAGLPVSPMFAVMLLKAAELGCAEEALSVVAMQCIESIFYFPRDKKEQAAQSRAKFVSSDGDQITLLNIYNGYKQCGQKQSEKWCRDHFINFRALRKVESVREQLRNYLENLHLPISSDFPNTQSLQKSILAGFFLNTAMRYNGEDNRQNVYKPIIGGSELVQIHPSSTLFQRKSPPQWVVYSELVFTSKHYIRSVMAFEKEWLVEIAPKFFKKNVVRN
ncbi:hypothetical protein ABG067_000414 [Albugo candida]